MRVRVLLSGYYGFGNAGDEAVCAAILQTMRTHGGAPEITVITGSEDYTRRLHDAPCVSRRSLLKALPRHDALFQGGGSLLQDATSARSVYYYLWVILAARLIRRPVFLYAQGIGPLRHRVSRAAVRVVLNRVQGISVRDRRSRDLLAEIGVSRPPVYLTADPVWALEPAPAERAATIWARQGLPANGRTVGIAARAAAGAPNLASSLGRAAASLQERGFDVTFLPMQRPRDEVFGEEMRRHMPRVAPALLGEYTPSDVMALVARVDFLIGMRLHALIFAAVQGVPVLGLSYDPKVEAVLSELRGAPPLEVESLEPEALEAAFHAAWGEREAAGHRLALEARRLRDNALGNARLARDFLRSHLAPTA